VKQYHEFLNHILTKGEQRGDRTGTGTISVFGYQMRFDLSEGFPLQTTKKVHFKSVLGELLWFISGSTNIHDLHKYGVTIWDEWALTREWCEEHGVEFPSHCKDGDLGPIYGSRWRKWGILHRTLPDGSGEMGMLDPLRQTINQIKNNPLSRRHIVSAWDPSLLPDEALSPQENVIAGNMALAPCHMSFHFYVSVSGKLSCHMYQRSADALLGVPFNIASYATLLMMVAKITNLTPGELIISFGDAHIYNNHTEQVKEVLRRTPKPLPTLVIHGDQKTLDDFKMEHFQLFGYTPDAKISAPIAV